MKYILALMAAVSMTANAEVIEYAQLDESQPLSGNFTWDESTSTFDEIALLFIDPVTSEEFELETFSVTGSAFSTDSVTTGDANTHSFSAAVAELGTETVLFDYDLSSNITTAFTTFTHEPTLDFGDPNVVAAVPEPQTYMMMAAGLALIGFQRVKKAR